MSYLYKVLWLTTMLSMPFSAFSADFEAIFKQFKENHPEYSEFELIMEKSKDHDKPVAHSADADKDGFEDIIFGMHDGRIKQDRESPKWVVVLKGQNNNQFKTILINQILATYGSYISVNILGQGYANTPYFYVGVHSGGFVLQSGPGTSFSINFNLRGLKLPIRQLSYITPWRTESATTPREYWYDFEKLQYQEAWEAIEYDKELGDHGPVAKFESGNFKLNPDIEAIYLQNDTDPFKDKGERRVTPIIISDNTIRVPIPQ